jgi:hypothetical protein
MRSQAGALAIPDRALAYYLPTYYTYLVEARDTALSRGVHCAYGAAQDWPMSHAAVPPDMREWLLRGCRGAEPSLRLIGVVGNPRRAHCAMSSPSTAGTPFSFVIDSSVV